MIGDCEGDGDGDGTNSSRPSLGEGDGEMMTFVVAPSLSPPHPLALISIKGRTINIEIGMIRIARCFRIRVSIGFVSFFIV